MLPDARRAAGAKPLTSDRDSNTAKRRLGGTPIHCGWASDRARARRTWFQDPMKLRFSTSYRRKNSVRDKVIGKKWIDSERNTLHRQRVSHPRGRVWRPPNVAWLAFTGRVIS